MTSFGPASLSEPKTPRAKPGAAVARIAKTAAVRTGAITRRILKFVVIFVTMVAGVTALIAAMPSIKAAIDTGLKRYEERRAARDAEESKKLAACHQYDVRLAFLSQKAKDYSSFDAAKTVMRREFQQLERLHKICRG